MSPHAPGPAHLPDAPASDLEKAPAGYTITTLGPEHVPALHALETVLFPLDAWPEQMFREELAHPEWRRYWGVRTATGELVGYCGAQYSPRLADVQTIGVLAAHEGHGLGSFLLRLMVERASAWGATDLLLEVRQDNPRAQALYVRHGFETIHTRKGYYNDGTDALIMQRALGGSDSGRGDVHGDVQGNGHSGPVPAEGGQA